MHPGHDLANATATDMDIDQTVDEDHEDDQVNNVPTGSIADRVREYINELTLFLTRRTATEDRDPALGTVEFLSRHVRYWLLFPASVLRLH
jgi:hypothetical protein